MFRPNRIALSLIVIALGGAGCANQPSSHSIGSTTLIDGNTGLGNWNQVGEANWRAEGGAIVADKKTGKPISYLVSKSPYKDFAIHAEFWVSDDANSGIFLRCVDSVNIDSKNC